MKKLKLLTALLVSFLSYSQINVIKQNNNTIKIGETQFSSLKKIDSIYVFTYQDLKFQSISVNKSFYFKDKDNAFENLYNVIIKGFEEVPKEDITIELPNDIIYLHYTKNLGIVSLQIGHFLQKTNVIGLTQWFTRKQINKIFGKK